MKRDDHIKHIESLVALPTKWRKKTATGWRCAGCHQAREKRTVWVAYTNTDCTEGRGHDVPIAVCAAEATALRLARKRYVQGSDGPVRAKELVKLDGEWYAPSSAFTVVGPTREDVAAQAAVDAKREAVAKAKAAGLTDADLLALGLRA